MRITHMSTVPRPQLEVRDLELVLALAETGSTAAAATRLHLTQSAISRALTQAEERVGVRLFERVARGVLPTLAGERLIAGAPRLLGELGQLERSLATPVAPPKSVRIVCECYTAYRWLPSAAARLNQAMPDLQLRVDTKYTLNPVEGLVQGRIDVALLTTGELPKTQAGPMLTERPLFSDEVVFLVSAQHRLARQESLTAADLVAERLITSNAPPAEVAWFLRSVFGRKRPKLRFQLFPLTEAIIDSARAGMGIAVLSEWMASGYLANGDLVSKRLSTGRLRRPWRIAYQRDSAQIAERLIEPLQASLPGASQRSAVSALAPTRRNRGQSRA